jgi:hypothetical protein
MLPTDSIAALGVKLADFLSCSQTLGLQGLVQKIGQDLFFKEPKDHEMLIREVELIRTFIHLLSDLQERNPKVTLSDFLKYLDRLEAYGHELPLAVFSGESGVRVLTLHSSKGLEFTAVYIAHIDEAALMKGKRSGFALPASIEARMEVRNELTARRTLYVAVTRAKEFCAISYSRHSYSGAELSPARILADMPEKYVIQRSITETEKDLLSADPLVYVTATKVPVKATFKELTQVVAAEYQKITVSVTLLNNFFECPWKWYFRSLLQVSEMKTESLIMGSAVHTGIEYLLKHRGNGNEKELEEKMIECMEKEFVCDETMMTRIIYQAKKVLDHFSKTYLPHIDVRALSERPLSYRDREFPHLSCYGKIDLTEREANGTVHVTDFKTGNPKSARIIEKRDEEGRMSPLLRQLAMYAFLISGAERGTNVGSSKLLFLEAKPNDSDAVYAKTVGQEELALLRQDIKDYDTLVSSGEWVERTCTAETYGEGECEYCRKARSLYF